MLPMHVTKSQANSFTPSVKQCCVNGQSLLVLKLRRSKAAVWITVVTDNSASYLLQDPPLGPAVQFSISSPARPPIEACSTVQHLISCKAPTGACCTVQPPSQLWDVCVCMCTLVGWAGGMGKFTYSHECHMFAILWRVILKQILPFLQIQYLENDQKSCTTTAYFIE